MIDQGRLDKGLYWQQAWKLVEGCTKVSPGCDNCWSEAETVMGACHPNEKISNRAHNVLGGMLADHFDGSITCRTDNLDLPLRKKKPTVFAVWNDLFHEDVPTEFIDRAYAVMALCPQHTFLVLTKRSDRMADYATAICRHEIAKAAMYVLNGKNWTDPDSVFDCVAERVGEGLSNLWLGATIENQEMADLRINDLLRVPGKRFVSIEPMLGAVDLSDFCNGWHWQNPLTGKRYHDSALGESDMNGEKIHAVLLGGESGKNASPMHPDWVRNIRDQCELAGTPFFFKQWGEWRHFYADDPFPLDIKKPAENIRRWNMPHRGFSARVGKKKAGRTLDDKLHIRLPWLSV